MIQKSGVYVIRRIDTDDCYVGSSQHIARRIRQHRGDLRRGAHDNPRLQSAWNKHGADAFLFEIVETCAPPDLYAREQFVIDTLRPIYNAAPCADSPMRGRTHTAASKAKMAETHKNHPCMTTEWKAALADKLRGNKNALGCTRSLETRAKLAAAQRGRTHTVSAEARARMSAAQMGNRKGVGHVFSPENRAKHSERFKGRVFSAETIAKMSAAQLKRRRRDRLNRLPLLTGSV